MESFNGIPVKVEYIVHKVDPAKDTLFKLAHKYKVNQKEILRVNNYASDNIAVFKELLIPYKGQQVFKGVEMTEEEKK